ncbi:hypothetical protein AAVH_25310 [Aphelenchoides avenae]|nr:hypothetical protein AAVH_25310 [Aphelenchus avenae]
MAYSTTCGAVYETVMDAAERASPEATEIVTRIVEKTFKACERKKAYIPNRPGIVCEARDRIAHALEQCFNATYMMRIAEGYQTSCTSDFDFDESAERATRAGASYWRFRHTPGWWRIFWRTLDLELYAAIRGAPKPGCLQLNATVPFYGSSACSATFPISAPVISV